VRRECELCEQVWQTRFNGLCYSCDARLTRERANQPPGTAWVWKEEVDYLSEIRAWGRDKLPPRLGYEFLTGMVVPKGTAYVEEETAQVDGDLSVR